MNIDLSRRGFLKLAGAGVAATSLGALGFGEAEAAELAHVRAFKLAATRTLSPRSSRTTARVPPSRALPATVVAHDGAAPTSRTSPRR